MCPPPSQAGHTRETKGAKVFASFFKKKVLFFFEKKNQKTFVCLAFRNGTLVRPWTPAISARASQVFTTAGKFLSGP
jgi:hypothetical protein